MRPGEGGLEGRGVICEDESARAPEFYKLQSGNSVSLVQASLLVQILPVGTSPGHP